MRSGTFKFPVGSRTLGALGAEKAYSDAEIGRAVEAATESVRREAQSTIDAAIDSLPADRATVRIFGPERVSYVKEGDVWRLRVRAKSAEEYAAFAAMERYNEKRPWSSISGGTFTFYAHGAVSARPSPAVLGKPLPMTLHVSPQNRVSVTTEYDVAEQWRALARIPLLAAQVAGSGLEVVTTGGLAAVWPDIKKWVQVGGLVLGGVVALLLINTLLPRD